MCICRGGAAGPAGPVLAGPLFGRIIYSYRASPQLKMRGVATLDDFAHAGACALSNAGARRAIGKCAHHSGTILMTSWS